MARKKQQTYNDMIRTMSELQEKVGTEKDRIAGVMASALDYRTAEILGDFSDTDLLRIATLMFSHIKVYADQVMSEKQGKKMKLMQQQTAGTVEGEMRHNYDEHCWDIWDTDTDKCVGKIYNGMHLEFLYRNKWVPVRVEMQAMETWYMVLDDGIVNMFGGLRVRCPS